MIEPQALRRAMLAASLILKRDLETAAVSGDTARRDARSKLVDALELVAGDGEALHLITEASR